MINRLQEEERFFPGLCESFGAYFESTNHRKDPEDIIDTDADQIMEPCGEHHKPQSDHGVWQSIRNRGEDNLFALREPIAMHCMLGHIWVLNRGACLRCNVCIP